MHLQIWILIISKLVLSWNQKLNKEQLFLDTYIYDNHLTKCVIYECETKWICCRAFYSIDRCLICRWESFSHFIHLEISTNNDFRIMYQHSFKWYNFRISKCIYYEDNENYYNSKNLSKILNWNNKLFLP